MPSKTIVFLLFVLGCRVHLYGADGFGGSATGGAGGPVVTVSNLTNFKYYATSPDPYIIRVAGTINLNGKVQPKPNKTIEGVGHDATIIGNLDLSGSQSCDNVIIRNLNITNPAGDGITVWRATNIFITHCNIYDCGDGAIDMNNGTDYITVSWCRFYYPSMAAHRFVHIADQAHITFHHNWYDTGCDQRMPASTGGRIHMYNNYFSCTGNYYCSNARADAQILSEYNYYDHVNNPIYADADKNGLIRTVGNLYDGCTGKIASGTDSVFTPPYAYTVHAAQDVPWIVIARAGTLLYGDLNGDDAVDTADLVEFGSIWLAEDAVWTGYFDLDGNGGIGFAEFSQLAQGWLIGPVTSYPLRKCVFLSNKHMKN